MDACLYIPKQATTLVKHTVVLRITDDECNRANGILWTCQKLKNCPEALDRVKMRDYPVICGFEGNEPIICCKLPSIPNGSTNEATGTPSVFGNGSEGDPLTVGKPEPLTEPKSSSSK